MKSCRSVRVVSEARRALSLPGGLSLVPFLRLRGRWLAAAGFPVGARVVVRVEPGRIVLEPEGSPDA